MTRLGETTTSRIPEIDDVRMVSAIAESIRKRSGSPIRCSPGNEHSMAVSPVKWIAILSCRVLNDV